ncbi:DUF294 nucleotidyltransferase-like domain-containing protein [Mesobacillus foraminis]|uniref:DUF294 nucleotidyltransferase-like domain-containing protein n=1 Tax=Mesobacillus foraminis TaxID=279826 RepID=UPI000EF53906|nr:DUF294 nucleotidyltransferase-like domain-containing protein [Mesobacillus foraminis]
MQPNHFNKIMEAVQFHPLFQGLEQGTALSLVRECEVKAYQKHEVMLKGDAERKGLLLLLEGIAEVCVGEEVLEVIQKGEMAGFSSLADFLGIPSPEDHLLTVELRAVELVKVLFIPFAVLARRWDDSNVHDYILSQVAIRLRDVYGSLAEQVSLARQLGEKEPFISRVQDIMSEEVVSIPPGATVQEAARAMSDKRVSSVLVTEEGKLEGIITERDIVQRVVAGGKSFQNSASQIMTPDPIVIPRLAYVYEAISEMVLKGIKHLPVIEGEKTVGIVTLSDLGRRKNASVLKTIRQIEEADETGLREVKEAVSAITDHLLREQVPVFTLLETVTSLYDRGVSRAVDLAAAKLGRPPAPFAFYQMGSSGRGEQFMLTDQDHFLIYEDGGDHAYFKKLGCEIVSILEQAGYASCQGLMMASEEQWRGTVSQWQERVRQWMVQSTNTNLLLAQNFFSYRLVAGSEEVGRGLESGLRELLARSKIFLYRLAQAEREQRPIPDLDQPIRSLFKMERKSLDLKKEVLFPYHHSLQILALKAGILGGTTLEKISALEQKGVFTADFAQDVRAAASQVLSLYIRLRWNEDSGDGSSVLTFSGLSTREKDELMLSLRTLKKLQGSVFAQFPL